MRRYPKEKENHLAEEKTERYFDKVANRNNVPKYTMQKKANINQAKLMASKVSVAGSEAKVVPRSPRGNVYVEEVESEVSEVGKRSSCVKESVLSIDRHLVEGVNRKLRYDIYLSDENDTKS